MTSTLNHQPSTHAFFHGKKVLLTGHTGFKGSWLTLWLQRLGAQVSGISLPPNTTPNLFSMARIADGIDSHFVDIRNLDALHALLRTIQPEIVFHLAAQPLVRASYRAPVATFASNVMGTVHVLDSLRGLSSVRVAVMITTDKVYRNPESARPFQEDDALGGFDPYSASKAACEIAIASYRDSFLTAQGVAVASARAGNVIGGGDWADDRLIPDAVRAWQSGQTLEIRRPEAIRPWQHVLEPLAGYLTLAQQLWQNPALTGAYNFGPDLQDAVSVRTVIELARSAYGRGNTHFDNSDVGPHEATTLTLATDKAQRLLGVTPKWHLNEAIARTLSWYRTLHAGGDARNLCLAEIAEYEAAQ